MLKVFIGKRYYFLPVVIIFILTVLLFIGCTRSYQPVSEWEQSEFDKANREIYPDDVRQSIELYKDTTVAWPGLIKSAEVIYDEEGPIVEYLLEHHYYDWIEDSGIQREKIFLSPRGEGEFATTWELHEDITATDLEELTDPTFLLIVYGTPVIVEGNVITLKASYIRGIDSAYYTREKMDYGR